MNIVSFRQAPRIETPIVVVRLQFQSLSHPPPATGNYGQSAGMFFIRSSGRFLRQGTRRILNLFGHLARGLSALVQPAKQTARGFSKCFAVLRCLIFHGANHGASNVRSVGKVVGEIGNAN